MYLNKQILIKTLNTKQLKRSNKSTVKVFKVHTQATKKEISHAFQSTFKKQKPIKVRTAKIPAKKVFRLGKGTKSAYKKAYIYLAANQ